jgi:hypothetical protein
MCKGGWVIQGCLLLYVINSPVCRNISPIHDDVVLLVGKNNSSVGNAEKLAIGRY